MSIKVGDVVRLNSGGPDMTVNAKSNPLGGRESWECVWFDDESHLHTGFFVEESLVKNESV